MEREIKFRFWIEKVKKMGTWETALEECNRLSLLNLEGWIPMQYTGLKDKNGTEIYEGDIVIIQDEYCNYEQSYNEETDTYTNIEKHKIVWEDDNVCFNLRKLNGDYLDEPFYWENLEIEVIGNIFENENLIK